MGLATVAVLFTDLSGSTATAERLGPAAADDARRQHFAALRSAIRQHNGDEVKSTGDGLMVVFASASDAVACAATMQRTTETMTLAAGTGVRIGVSAGEASNEDDDWYGRPVVLAARLCDAAAPGVVYVDQLVASLAGRADVTFEPVGDLELKGIKEPLATLQLRWSTAAPAIPLQPALHQTGAFVGRTPQLDALMAAHDRAAEGHPVLMLLAGEPGAGKTTIAAEFARTMHDRGATVLFGRCSDAPGLAYQPFVQALGHYIQHADQWMLAEHVATHGGELLRLSSDLSSRVPDLPDPAVGDPVTEQWRFFQAARALVAAAGRSGPVVLVLDDVHWASAPTLHLLTHLVRTDDPASLLVIATYRDTELSRTHPLADALAELRRAGAVERLAVDGLELAETVALVESAAGEELGEQGRTLARAVYERTEGNPFFVIEVLRHLVESGAIVHTDGHWAAGNVDAGLPEGVKEVVGRRLRHLSEHANRVLSVGAVVGLDFDLDIVAHVLAVPPGDLFDALDEARAAGIVRELAPGRYCFTHALIRSTVGDEASASRVVYLHGKVADAIETVHADNLEPWLADLAFHQAEAAHAGRTEAAVDAAIRAAAQARTHAATDEAEAILERGLQAAQLAEPPDDGQLVRLYVALAETAIVTAPLRARAWAVDAAAAADRIGGAGLVAAAASVWSAFNTTVVGSVAGDTWLVDLCNRALAVDRDADPALRARVLSLSVLLGWWTASDIDIAEVDEAVDVAFASSDPVAQIIATQAQFMARGVVDPRLEYWPEYLALIDTALASTADPYLRGLAAVYMSWGASAHGDGEVLSRATASIEESARALSGGRMATWASWLHAMEQARVGEWDTAIELAKRARTTSVDPAIGETIVLLHYANALLHRGSAAEHRAVADLGTQEAAAGGSFPLLYHALLLALSGDHEAASRELAALLEEDVFASDVMVVVTLGIGAWAAAVASDTKAAAAFEARLRPFCGFMCAGGMVELGSVNRLVGALAALDGRYDEADALFRSGLELEEGYGGVVMAAHTCFWWARCLLDRSTEGDRDRAVELLDVCLDTAERLGMQNLVSEAKALRARTP